jgi:hypothetical protein
MSKSERINLAVAAGIGAAAGAVGTLAMDLVWYRRYRGSGGESGFADWEFSTATEGFEDAGAPAEVGRRIVEVLFRTHLAPDTAGITNNLVHWGTGMGWGTALAMVARSRPLPIAVLGPAGGVVAWGTSYAVLGSAGIYQPMWEYEARTLWKDLTAHLAFGMATATTFRFLSRLGS